MRASIYLLETDSLNRPMVIPLVPDAEYKDIAHVIDAAHLAKNERYVYRPGILFACVDGEHTVKIS